jgi:hypothetical protein
VRLTNRKGVRIEEVGPPEGIITSLGPFITGEAAVKGGRRWAGGTVWREPTGEGPQGGEDGVGALLRLLAWERGLRAGTAACGGCGGCGGLNTA